MKTNKQIPSMPYLQKSSFEKSSDDSNTISSTKTKRRNIYFNYQGEFSGQSTHQNQDLVKKTPVNFVNLPGFIKSTFTTSPKLQLFEKLESNDEEKIDLYYGIMSERDGFLNGQIIPVKDKEKLGLDYSNRLFSSSIHNNNNASSCNNFKSESNNGHVDKVSKQILRAPLIKAKANSVWNPVEDEERDKNKLASLYNNDNCYSKVLCQMLKGSSSKQSSQHLNENYEIKLPLMRVNSEIKSNKFIKDISGCYFDYKQFPKSEKEKMVYFYSNNADQDKYKKDFQEDYENIKDGSTRLPRNIKPNGYNHIKSNYLAGPKFQELQENDKTHEKSGSISKKNYHNNNNNNNSSSSSKQSQYLSKRFSEKKSPENNCKKERMEQNIQNSIQKKVNFQRSCEKSSTFVSTEASSNNLNLGNCFNQEDTTTINKNRNSSSEFEINYNNIKEDQNSKVKIVTKFINQDADHKHKSDKFDLYSSKKFLKKLGSFSGINSSHSKPQYLKKRENQLSNNVNHNNSINTNIKNKNNNICNSNANSNNNYEEEVKINKEIKQINEDIGDIQNNLSSLSRSQSQIKNQVISYQEKSKQQQKVAENEPADTFAHILQLYQNNSHIHQHFKMNINNKQQLVSTNQVVKVGKKMIKIINPYKGQQLKEVEQQQQLQQEQYNFNKIPEEDLNELSQFLKKNSLISSRNISTQRISNNEINQGPIQDQNENFELKKCRMRKRQREEIKIIASNGFKDVFSTLQNTENTLKDYCFENNLEEGSPQIKENYVDFSMNSTLKDIVKLIESESVI